MDKDSRIKKYVGWYLHTGRKMFYMYMYYVNLKNSIQSKKDVLSLKIE